MTTELLLDHLTKQLQIPTIAAQYRSLAREAEDRNFSYEEFLLALLEAESESREENQRQRRLKFYGLTLCPFNQNISNIY
ncbi:IS21 family transposase [Neobacillus bataviensis LMG 21833]|uniref:IS21 family transposase n=1 Tax=Neobacillus bataviensis LMG 21833 TaxID=1117379 RepID=K6CIB8_9BACI|nr:ATP-binding protein [Neobacillus bataviensis]EKN70905.1 IS21 family transposase [Neobacillus bataviensis LMG 21833]